MTVPQAYSLAEAGALLGISGDSVRRMEQAGTIRTIRIPGIRRVTVPATEVERILSGRLEQTEASLRLVRGAS